MVALLVNAAGVWTYNLNNTSANVQALNAGVTVTDTFTVVSQDGTASQPVTISIVGTNDIATISGTSTGATQEDVTTVASGTLVVSDVDTGQSFAVVQTATAGTYGSLPCQRRWCVDL